MKGKGGLKGFGHEIRPASSHKGDKGMGKAVSGTKLNSGKENTPEGHSKKK